MRKDPRFPNLTICDDLGLTTKLNFARDRNTDPWMFRQMINEVSELLAPYVFADHSVDDFAVSTPMEEMCVFPCLDTDVAFVPIYRAAERMLDGFWKLVPEAPVWHVGMKRDEKPPFKPTVYLNKLPDRIASSVVCTIDIMLATGGSQIETVNLIKARIGDATLTRIKVAAIVSAPEGIKALQEAHPDVQIYTVALDRCLNEKGYILPGLGDAGDRCYNTEDRVDQDRPVSAW